MLEMEQTALAPINAEAEKRVIGALILDRDLISEQMLRLKPEHFHLLNYRYIYDAICKLYIDGNPTSPESIANVLKNKKEMDKSRLELVGGANGIFDCIEGVGTEEIDYWSGEVVKKFEERQLLSFANEARRLALSNPSDIGKLRSSLEERLVSLSNDNSESSVPIAKAMPELGERIDRYIDFPDSIIGIPTTYNRLDTALDGLQKGNVSIVYAPSSRFKSLFVTNVGWRLAEQGYPGLWFTTEMPRVQVMERLLQLEAGVNLKWLRRDKKMVIFKERLMAAQKRLSSHPIYFCDTSSLDVQELRTEVNRHKRWHDIDYIIVDLVDHISSSRFKDEMVNNQRVVMASMKQIAKDFDVHIILVSHVVKGNEQQRKQADLDVEDMIGTAAKYQDVDASLSIAPVKYDELNRLVAMSREEILYKVATDKKLDVLISVTKNRHGELVRCMMELDFEHGGRFDDNWIKPIEKEPTQAKLTDY